MEYAVIETGNKQYIVEEGSIVSIEKLDQEAGENVRFDKIPLHVKGETVAVGKPYSNVIVEGTIVEHNRDPKKQGLRYKPGQYRSQYGHKQHKTVVKITKISAQ